MDNNYHSQIKTMMFTMIPPFLKSALYATLALSSVSYAHSPFIAPQAYLVEGDHTTLLAGYAEAPFVSEFAIKGYEISVINPLKQIKPIETVSTTAVAIADIEIKAEGTYKLSAVRDQKIDYVDLKGKWYRVMENHGDAKLSSLSERNFITPSELKETKVEQTLSTIRNEQLISFLSKDKWTNEVLVLKNKGLEAEFSVHPNAINEGEAFTLSLTADGKAQKDLEVIIQKQKTKPMERVETLKLVTDAKGQIQLNFPKPGQYLIEINSSKTVDYAKPQAQSYRQNISLYVH